jgi:hypothetical protein
VNKVDFNRQESDAVEDTLTRQDPSPLKQSSFKPVKEEEENRPQPASKPASEEHKEFLSPALTPIFSDDEDLCLGEGKPD